MAAPPVPPRPYGQPPPLPPLPPMFHVVEESPPRFDSPMPAPRPHRIDRSIPVNIARTLDEQIQQQPTSLTAPLPSIAHLQTALGLMSDPTHDPALKIAWCRDVFFLIDIANHSSSSSDPPIGPIVLSDPILKSLADTAIPLALQFASTVQPGHKAVRLPPHIAESIAMRATLATTGAFPAHLPHNPRAAFRDFETAARNGFASAWFRLGREYENFNDHQHAKECFERGVRLGVESCLYRTGMSHLLGQLSFPPSPQLALPLLHRAALLASLTCPQPAYVYALLLLSEFTLPALPASLLSPALFAPFIPPGSSPHLEARKHLERAAFLHFSPAQYKLGHAYEFADPPFPFDPILSVQYYSLASQQGEVEADMALSKWFLCGSGGAATNTSSNIGGFDKDEPLALHFAQKAASNRLPSALFAMGYYAEVGVGQPRDVEKARIWYTRAVEAGNNDANDRLRALMPLVGGGGAGMSREEHELITQAKVVRRRTMAIQRMANEPLSPPWEGKVFPTLREDLQQRKQTPLGGADGRRVVENIRKNSFREPPQTAVPTMRPPSPRALPQAPVPPPPRYPWGDSVPGPTSGPLPPTSSPSSSRIPAASYPYHLESPGLPRRKTPPPPGPPTGGRAQSPARARENRERLERLRLNLDSGDGVQPTASTTTALSVPATAPTTTTTNASNNKSPTKSFQTFAEMGVHGAKAEDKDCVVM